ncbi:MAG: alkanesulfonate monooxygenase SsuD [Flavobacterium sp.]|jgi:alkanesulfonate monooxygenase SsuD/methylene tetrahydromethanopterin reductase-like flavin-dependent oxidoreductase (luciferase family)
MNLKVGLATPTNFWASSFTEKSQLLDKVSKVGIDHLFMADHVSFHNGSGTDGFIEIAALSQLHPSLGVMISIYLLPLRHPLPVARQLATMQKVAPGRMIFGVGIGGEDRHEIEVCGVDPRTRGKRTNESLHILRGLMAGETVNYDGEILQVENARIKPTIGDSIPIIVGGRSDAALKRAGQYGDGWIATWCSVKRFKEALKLVDETAIASGRKVNWQHGYQPWVGVADTKAEARVIVAREMEAFYKIPFEKFEKYTPYGTPADVADHLAPYVQNGCSIMNLKVCAANDNLIVEGAGEIASALRSVGNVE